MLLQYIWYMFQIVVIRCLDIITQLMEKNIQIHIEIFAMEQVTKTINIK